MNNRDDQKLQVQQATDVVHLIGEQIALRPRGREFLGLCPFHDDKSPSLHVSPAKQIYKCFSCGAGGDVFSFMMNYHKMTFPEALEHLAQRAGIVLEKGRGPRAEGRGAEGDEQEGPTERQLIGDANVKAVEFFRALLRHREHGQIARDYIAKRGISAAMVEAFQIGYAPDRWDGMVSVVRQKAWNTRAFQVAGLISERKGSGFRVQGSEAADVDAADAGRGHVVEPESRTLNPEPSNCYDRFRHRLMFPICDALGRPIAFGARKLREEDEPKYLNSPEHALFSKSATLFGLHLAKKAIIDSSTAVIVEGYTDVIACHQAGQTNVVAALGTAFTAEHARQLRRYADRVVLIFDADEAGQKAADRAVEIVFTESLDVAVAVLPDGLDPADLLAQPEGAERWRAAITDATDALSYQFARFRSRFEQATTVTARQRLVEEYLRGLAGLGLARSGAIRRALIVQRLSELLHMRDSAVSDMLRRLTPVARPPATGARAVPETAASAAPDSAQTPRSHSSAAASQNAENADNWASDVALSLGASKIKAVQQAERQIIGCLLHLPELFHRSLSDGRTLDEALMPDDLVTPAAQRLYQRLYDRLSAGDDQGLLTHTLADLAAQGEQDLANLLTQAEADVEIRTEGLGEKIQELFVSTAEAILAYRREFEYEEQRQAFEQLATTTDDSVSEAEAVRKLLEHRRHNPSPARIARLAR